MPARHAVVTVCVLAAALAGDAFPARAQDSRTAISATALRRHLSRIADDSMGGRVSGSRGNYLAAEYLAAELRRLGLGPAGENGSYFQTVPFVNLRPDTSLRLVVGGKALRVWTDLIPMGDWKADGASGAAAVYGGIAGDSATWPQPDAVRGRLVVLAPPPVEDPRTLLGPLFATVGSPRMAGARAFALLGLEGVSADLREYLMMGILTTDTTVRSGPPVVLLFTPAAEALLGGPPSAARLGVPGPALSGGFGLRRVPRPWPTRNVVAVLRGSDPALAGTYVSVSAHNDHVGYTTVPVDHDSVYAHNHVLRPFGPDSPDRLPTPAQTTRIAAVRDSLRRLRPDRADSVLNGADDDGSGTVGLLEIARVLAAGPRPRRSVLFVSHVLEEPGRLGSAWFTDHPTVPRDSIVGEVDLDMIGRGGPADVPEGGPRFLLVTGARRVSREFGDLLERVNAGEPLPFRFDYAYDAPGHRYGWFCRTDAPSYGRYGIPAVSLSRGMQADYHQVTDEVEYIDFAGAARVAALTTDFVRAVASLDHRPVVDGPRLDPRAPCRQ